MVLAAARVAAKHKRVFLTSGATSPRLPRQVPRYLFLACFGDNVQAAAGAEWAVKTLKARTAVVLYKQTSTYASCCTAISRRGSSNWAARCWRSRLTRSQRSRRAVQGAAEGRPRLFRRAARRRRCRRSRPCAAPASRRRSSAATGSISATPGNRSPHADKIYFTTHAYLGADNPDPRVQAFRAAFAKAYPGKEPDAFAALGYDTGPAAHGRDRSPPAAPTAGRAQGAGRDRRLRRRDRHDQLSRRQPHPGEIGQHHGGDAGPPEPRGQRAAGENPGAVRSVAGAALCFRVLSHKIRSTCPACPTRAFQDDMRAEAAVACGRILYPSPGGPGQAVRWHYDRLAFNGWTRRRRRGAAARIGGPGGHVAARTIGARDRKAAGARMRVRRAFAKQRAHKKWLRPWSALPRVHVTAGRDEWGIRAYPAPR